ncbi:N-acetylmuramoyl-L-alanine amidase [Pseudoxanthomonas japonensis]|uniref:N-acetylmuramoyl-L-alanine amidase n=1 Tax=Pseudoxanthomonas japonensis TaxID=69284 RepID=A0ABQ6ZKC6_9GAMM|nr:N-acetylmuramoyl-L-alanine amidase [Pseudoxanthomonas japonensis]KAF1726638.1 N-acetylmuramoyl-L-alanine amidase [Pseudoxanthomonas japonensis]
MSPGIPTTATLRLALAAVLAVVPCTLLAGEVTGVTVAQGSTGTRAEIQLAGAGQYKTLALKGPDRLVVDLPASTAKAGLRLPAPAGVVRAVRTGQPDANTLRVVFDLASPVTALKPRMEQEGANARLVIEWPGDGATVPATSVATNTSAAPATATPSTSPQADAARATALLTAQVVQAGAASESNVPTALAAAGPSPQAILNGQPSAAVPSATTERPAYTIATGQPSVPPTATTTVEQPAAVPADEQARPAVAMAKGMRPLVVAIDPGHGGQDPGAVGPNGTHEKHVVLQIARELARQINATPGLKAFLTRDTDVFIPLPQRARLARAARADIFVSLHADAAENRAARGSSVYVLSLKGASSQRARWLADKENSSDLIGGVALQKVDNTLSSILLDLAQSGHMRASENAADHVLAGLKRIGNNHKPNIERANFAVLRTSDMPAMLVETAFISNPDEERRLKDPAYQRQIASAVLDGVQTYFTRQPPPGTLFAARAQAEADARTVAAGGAAGAP